MGQGQGGKLDFPIPRPPFAYAFSFQPRFNRSSGFQSNVKVSRRGHFTRPCVFLAFFAISLSRSIDLLMSRAAYSIRSIAVSRNFCASRRSCSDVDSFSAMTDEV